MIEELRKRLPPRVLAPSLLATAAIVVGIMVLSSGGDDEPPASQTPAPSGDAAAEGVAEEGGAEEGGAELADESGDADGESLDETTLASIAPTRTSWLPGQGSLVRLDRYPPIGDPAVVLGNRLEEAHRELLDAIEKARIEAKKEAERQARLAFLRAKRLAERQYQKALAEAREARREARREQRREEARIQRMIDRLREEGKIEPGEECDLPEVRAVFDCEAGYPF